MPTREQLSQAASLYVVAQNGLRVQFGELFRERKLIVCFIRHFWCAMCQDYMYAVSRKVDPEVLKLAGIDLVFIGVGSSAMIKSYRQIFRTPFAMYTDPTLRLHTALGMTRRTTDAGPETERGDYVRHGTIGGIAMVVRNALRVGMPVWEKGGDVAQLGGEFVFGPGLACAYSHRMAYTRSHAPVVDVLAAAGIRTVITSPGEGGPSVLYPDDGEIWMNARRGSVSRIQTKHEKREGGEHWSPDEQCNMPYLSDTGSVVGCWGSSVSKVESNQSPRDNVPREYSELRRDYSLPSETRKEYSEPPRGCRVKKPRRSFVVANPDQSHRDDLPPTPVEEEVGYDERGWESDGAASLAYLEESQAGRTPQMQYWLKQDSLSHSFGRT
ncbi:AhpC/TSA antioxidant enzyme-domain-containing protein [Sparassis latifolia]